MAPLVAAAIARFKAAWEDEVRPASRRALVAISLAVVFGVAHVARVGSPLARGLAGGALVLLLGALIARRVIARRRLADIRGVIRRTVSPTDANLGAATLRALTLVDRAATDPRVGSPALAELHLSRLLGRASLEDITERAVKSARRWSSFGLVAALGTLVVAVVEPFRVVEGLDVLLARRGEAPLDIVWLEDVEVVAKPPDYLHQSEESLEGFRMTSQPRGTVLTVRGRPVHPGRQLVLTDGQLEVPFIDDGSELHVARWTLGDSVSLSIASRFGSVRIRQPDDQPVTSIPDEAPKVTVDGAPRKVRLLEEPVVQIHYEATDDHGLREVNLVLRAGTREERRVLSRPAADARVDRGGYQILSTDPFFKRTYIPVEVTVEARDNDPVTGPKWGRSDAIVLVLPQVGEPEALRYAALVAARDAVTDLLAGRLEPYKDKAGATRKEHLEHESKLHTKAVAAVEAALSGNYGGLSVPGRVAALARGQLRRLGVALEAERKQPSDAKHRALIEATEEVLLAFDSGVRGIGTRDTRAVAKRLAEVADEAAVASDLAASPTDRPRGVVRLDAAVEVLDGGGKQMLKLGDLGLDLGEIVANDLRRIARARTTSRDGGSAAPAPGAEDLWHAELAARDLAARLRKPDPSFGGGGRGGVESGGSPSPDSGEPSDADEQMAAQEEELEQLARDHAAEMNEVADALERATSPEELEALREEAKKHAEAIREAVKNLPRPGADPGSAEAAGAAAREQAEAMAGALERGAPADAVGSGKESVKALKEAQRLGDGSDFFPDERTAREAGKAQGTLEQELAWAEQALEKLRQQASERAKADLERAGDSEEGLAERAKKLGEKGASGESALPQEQLDQLSEAEQKMRGARRSLGEGDGDGGLKQQREAQRLLEMAKGERNEEGEGRKDAPEGADGKSMAKKAEIPGKDRHKGPEAFRRRVLEGLGSSSDPLLKEAVRKYAEGLLR